NLNKFVYNKNANSSQNNKYYKCFKNNGEWKYSLYSILIHSGNINRGHYYAYISPKVNHEFYKFNDSLVMKINNEKEIYSQFGGDNTYSSAYLLVYIKDNQINKLFNNIEKNYIPKTLINYFENEIQLKKTEKIYKLKEI